jgi:replicative DNA helicase
MNQYQEMDFEVDTGPFPSVEMAERAILGMFMTNPKKHIPRANAEGLDRDCFYKTPRIYDAIIEAYRRYPEVEEIDTIELVSHLMSTGQIDGCGGPSAIMEIYSRGADFGFFRVYSAQLRECKARRMVILATERLKEAPSSAEAIQELKTSLEAVTGALAAPSRAKNWKQSVKAFIENWKNDFESTEAIPGLSTGFDEIDEISGGMRPGEQWIVCAKSTRGKSVMMLQIAAKAIQQGKTVAIFSLEMMESVVAGRLISVFGCVDYGAITQPKTSNKHHRSAIKRAVEETAEAKVWIDDTPNQTMDHIEAECQRIKDIAGALDLIVIDYMQIIKGEKQRGETREQEVARISMAGKQMAKKFGVPVLSASQLNGAGEVRESKSLEQDADTLLFIADDGIKIGKMRNGKRDQIIKLFMHGDKQKFLSYPPEHQ